MPVLSLPARQTRRRDALIRVLAHELEAERFEFLTKILEPSAPWPGGGPDWATVAALGISSARRMAERARHVAQRLPSTFGGWLERSHRRYRGAAMYQLRDRRREEGAPTFDEHGLAIPGRGLRRLVAGQLGDNLDAWLRSGEQDARLIREMFERHRGPLSEIGAILDFGSGCGRVARWWANLDGPELFGCDYDGRLTAWCRSNLPFLSVKTNSSRPPLPFRGETFDLIYAISLFTHLTEVAQDGWMQDLRRLLKPGALVLFTVHGERFVGHLTAEEREAFTAGRHVVRLPERSGREACAAFHPPSYVRDRLLPCAGLELLEAVDEGGPEEPIGSPMVLQDSYLVRKPATA